MALTNNTGADGRTQSLEAPCVRASFRPQAIILDDQETFFLAQGAAWSDSIPRVFIVTCCNTADGADAVAEYQTAIVHFFQEHCLVTPITLLDESNFDAAAQLISAGTDQDTTSGDDLTIGYDSTDDVYFICNNVGANTLVTITRIDGFTQDLVAETA